MADIPTGAVNIEDLPSVTNINDSDKIVVSRNGTVYQSSGLADLNADLTDKVKVKTITSISSLGLSAGCSTADVVNAMVAQGSGLEYWGGVTRSSSSISDLPCAGGVLHIMVASSSRVAIEVFRAAASGSTYPAEHFYGAMNSDWSAVTWYQATTSEVSTTSLNAIEPLNDDPVEA